MLKIFQIAYSLASGGAERFVVDLCNELARCSECQITLVTIVDDQNNGCAHYLPDLSNKVEYICLKAKSGLTVKALWNVFQLLWKRKPDVVHAHCGLIPLFLPAFSLRGVRFIQTLHSMADKTISFACLKPIYRYFYRYFIKPVTISKSCDDSYRNYYQLSNSVCVYNGRAPVVASMRITEVKEEVSSYKKGIDCPVFIHVARYSKAKNQQLLINVFEQLEAEGENFLLLILGAGHERADYYNRVDSPRIRFLGVKNNVGDYLACSDYFVLTSLWEGLPISLLEAMSFGCIPICTPAGGVIDVLNSPEVGYVSGSFSEADFYSLVKIVLKDNSAKKREKAKELFASQYTMEICAGNYFKLYNV